eukprot:GHVH01006895.1.p1 GENE.GHVH01006895.1~~GHVH01006895.1.p1  ORF type:complete len:519 (+),score=77.42 GHVH01006895.1:275-1831(+)
MSREFLGHSPAGVPTPVAIKEISTFCSRWSVIGKVIKSEPIRSFNTKTGDNSKVWNIIIGDDQGDEIVVVLWGSCVDKFESKISEGKVYSFSKGVIRMSNRKYTTCPHPYQITLNDDSQVIELEEQSSVSKAMPSIRRFNTEGGLRSIKSTLRERIDVVGVIVSFRPEKTITTKLSEEKFKREFIMCDSSGHKIAVDVWANNADQLLKLSDSSLANNPAVGIRNCRINEYRGKTLAPNASDIELFSQSSLTDDMTQLKHEMNWFLENQNRLDKLVSLTEEYQGGAGGIVKANELQIEGSSVLLKTAHDKMLATFVDEGREEQEILWRSVVYPSKFFWRGREESSNQPTCFYNACGECGRKWSTETGCLSCGERAKEEARYILMTGLADSSASRFNCRFFGKQADEVVGLSASILSKESSAGVDISEHLEWNALHKPLAVRFKAAVRSYNGESHANVSTLNCEALAAESFIKESLLMLSSLEPIYPDLVGRVDKSKRTREMDSQELDPQSTEKRQRIEG